MTGRLSSGSGEVLHGWSLEGLGISRETCWDVMDDLKTGRLVEVLAVHVSPPLDLYATFHPGRPRPPRIRLFVDVVASHLTFERAAGVGPVDRQTDRPTGC